MRKNCMKAAELLARENPLEKWQMAAVLAKGNKIISTGLNTYSGPNTLRATTAVPPEYCAGTHAETAALKPYQFDSLVGMDMYVARWRKDGLYGLALPCYTCYTHMLQKGIRRVYFTDGKGSYGSIRL